MLSVWITSSLPTVLSPTNVALGNFDGVHQGHRQVIAPILPTATSLMGEERVYPTVLTFDPHPQEFFSGEPRLLLTPLAQKVVLLQNLGVQQLVLLPFNADLAALSPQDFVETILVHHLNAKRISVGENFRFGYRRSGTVDDLRAIAGKFGIDVCIVPLETNQTERVSSSRIRQALLDGNLALANRFLGYPYTLVGNVVKGRQLGRTLGFPTANLQLPAKKFLPRHGVYAVQVQISGSDPIPGVMNLGIRPTVDNTPHLTAEVHLFDYSADLYGHTLSVGLIEFLRPEQKFADLAELQAQIQRDCQQAQAYLALQSAIAHPSEQVV